MFSLCLLDIASFRLFTLRGSFKSDDGDEFLSLAESGFEDAVLGDSGDSLRCPSLIGMPTKPLGDLCPTGELAEEETGEAGARLTLAIKSGGRAGP